LVGGSGGTVSGLATKITLGFVGGNGGTVSGLAAAITLGFVGGNGGTVRGLATAYVATAAIAVPKTKLRIFNELAVMTYAPCTRERTMQIKSNPKGVCPLQQK
jgi:hypothetical protein